MVNIEERLTAAHTFGDTVDFLQEASHELIINAVLNNESSAYSIVIQPEATGVS
jgi:hypothetical protein